MSLVPIADQYRVFVTCQRIFSDRKASLRKRKAVRREIQRCRSLAPVEDLVRDFGDEKIVSTACALLREGIFESNSKAQILFSRFDYNSYVPDVLATSLIDNDLSNRIITSDHARLKNRIDQENKIKDEIQNTSCGIPKRSVRIEFEQSLTSTKLPLGIQHIILTSTQRILEECCFEFGMGWIPEVLARHQWDCPEAVELNKIILVISDICETLPSGAILPALLPSMKQILRRTEEIRHTAVHRIGQTAQKIENMIHASCQLAQAFQDQQRFCLLRSMHKAVNQTILKRDIEKTRLRERFKQERDDVIRLRQQLDRREEAAMASMVRDDEKDSLLCAFSLEAAVNKILSSATAKSTPQERTEGLNAGNELEDSYRTSRLNHHEDAQIIIRDNDFDVKSDDLHTGYLEDVLGDDAIDDAEWDSVMATVGLMQQYDVRPFSPPVLTKSQSCAGNLLRGSNPCDNINDQQCCRASMANADKKSPPTGINVTSNEANMHFQHTGGIAEDQGVMLSSGSISVSCAEKNEKLITDSEKNVISKRRAAYDDQEERARLIQSKKLRISPCETCMHSFPWSMKCVCHISSSETDT